MSLIDRSIMLHIDSHERISGTHQDGEYNIINQLNGHDLSDFDKIVCMSATIPKSYYAIEAGFNTFQLRDTVATGYYTVTIIPGSYSALEFKEILAFEMTNASATSGDTWDYRVSFDHTQGKFTYSVQGNTEQPTIKTTINVYEQLGFLPNSENTFVGDSLKSTSVINMSPENNLMLRTSLCEGGNNNENIVQDLHMSHVPPFSYMQFYQQDVEGYSKNLNTNSTKVRFYITNEDSEKSGLQRTVQVNNNNWYYYSIILI